ncbi:putative ribonuclease H protein [Glycine max]|nr:putative ribonuclease H protein [Glycine max]
MVSGLRINFAKSQFGAIGQTEDWCRFVVDYLNCGPLQFPFISILQYVDDTVFFGEPTMQNVKVIKTILRGFELVSSLKINFAKSYFGAVGKSDQWVREAAGFLNCRILILTSKYKGWRGLEEGLPKQTHSFWWSDLRSIIHHSSMGDVLKQFLWKLGSGDQILFWEDSWVGDGITLRDKYPELYQISSQKFQIVESMESFGEAGWEWEFSWRRNLFDNELGRASAFIEQATALSPNATLKDYWVWGADPKGIFTTSTAYLCIKGDQPIGHLNRGFNQLWEIKVPPRALSFAWRLLWDRLPTKENLIRRQVVIENDLCTFCQSQVESASHLFFTCKNVMPMWWEFNSLVKEDRVMHCRPGDNFSQHFSLAGSRDSNRKWKIWWIAATISIWNLRNFMTFKNQLFVISKLVDNAIFLTWSWLRGWEKDFVVPF